ncbi:MAG TPA: tetratricopeptide repeat protein [Candidatus Polarisedimenticolia bacterium]|nr:tetratricopeptide repeat protein [Candidatus Polarisedimenticolia bacterium]
MEAQDLLISTPPPRRRGRLVLPACLGAALLAVVAVRPASAQGFGGTVEDILTRADNLLRQQKPNEAIAQFQEARTLCTTPFETVSALQGEARGRMQNREFLPAAGLFEEAVQRFPDDPRQPDLLYMAGMARSQGGDVEGAAKLLRKALDSNPTADLVPALRFWLARSLRLSGKPKEVVDLLKDFEKEFPANQLIPRSLYYLGLAQHDSGDLAGSETTYRHLIETYPHTQDTAEAFFDLGQVLAELGKREEAVQYLRTYANANPSSAVAARSMELAGDLSLFHSPKEAALYYGVARVKSTGNPVPATADLQVSRWLGSKTTIARWLSEVWVLIALAVVAAAILALVGWIVLRRLKGSRSRRPAAEPSNA